MSYLQEIVGATFYWRALQTNAIRHNTLLVNNDEFK